MRKACTTAKPATAVGLLLTLSACAGGSSYGRSLEYLLPDYVEAFRFYHGGSWTPRSIYAFDLTDSYIVVARNTEKKPYGIAFTDCSELAVGLQRLEDAVKADMKIVAGIAPRTLTDVVVVDGPVYELHVDARAINTEIRLWGGGNAQLVAGWVDAALEVRRIEESCQAYRVYEPDRNDITQQP